MLNGMKKVKVTLVFTYLNLTLNLRKMFIFHLIITQTTVWDG